MRSVVCDESVVLIQLLSLAFCHDDEGFYLSDDVFVSSNYCARFHDRTLLDFAVVFVFLELTSQDCVFVCLKYSLIS